MGEYLDKLDETFDAISIKINDLESEIESFKAQIKSDDDYIGSTFTSIFYGYRKMFEIRLNQLLEQVK